jgi:glycosyltransferase involved in cell wall biosynthesis
MSNLFESDPYPGNPKILFIGLGASSHTQSWIDLLSDSKLNVRLFSVPGGGTPPADWNIRTYICDPSNQLSEDLNPNTRLSLENKTFYQALVLGKKAFSFIYKRLGMPGIIFNYADYLPNSNLIKGAFPDVWLAKIIQEWRPDIIHTLGAFDGQGGAFYFNVRKRFGLENRGIWVLQLRGGSDIALRRHNPEFSNQIWEIFTACDEIITDNLMNIDYIKHLGMGHKVAPIAPVPGTGGLDINPIKEAQLPSKKERLILWPKAYESQWTKALPVLEAIELAWPQIQPCKIYMTAVSAETEAWFWTLPEVIRKNCAIVGRIPRDELLLLMKRARVLLIPSLVDGVPNSLYEAMVYGTFPIVSPLETIKPVVKNEENVLFARNLYPADISATLVRAMSDDDLVDRAAQNNFRLVEQIASRSMIAEKVINYYQELVG